MERNSDEKASFIWAVAPAKVVSTLAGSSPAWRKSSMRLAASSETAPVSLTVMSAVIVAAGAPSTRVTDPRTFTTSTSASWPKGRVPAMPLMGI